MLAETGQPQVRWKFLGGTTCFIYLSQNSKCGDIFCWADLLLLQKNALIYFFLGSLDAC